MSLGFHLSYWRYIFLTDGVFRSSEVPKSPDEKLPGKLGTPKWGPTPGPSAERRGFSRRVLFAYVPKPFRRPVPFPPSPGSFLIEQIGLLSSEGVTSTPESIFAGSQRAAVPVLHGGAAEADLRGLHQPPGDRRHGLAGATIGTSKFWAKGGVQHMALVFSFFGGMLLEEHEERQQEAPTFLDSGQVPFPQTKRG